MEPPGGRDSRFNLGYNMNLLSGETSPEIYGNPNLGRPSTSLQQLSPRHTMVSSACNRGLKSDIYDERGLSGQSMGLDSCVNEINEDSYSMQSKKSPPSNGKKTKGRVKIKMEYIENKLRRYTTFSKRKTGIMKKAYELSTLTGTQVMLLVASETGHVYTFATRKLQPMITSEAGKALIQTCLNSPDPPAGSAGGDQRMSATGFEETELTYNISDDDSKDGESGSESSSDEMDVVEETIYLKDPQQHQQKEHSAVDPLELNLTKNEVGTSSASNSSKIKSEYKISFKEQEPPQSIPLAPPKTDPSCESTTPLIVPSIASTSTVPLTIPITTTTASGTGAMGSSISTVGATQISADVGTSLRIAPALNTIPGGLTNRPLALPLVLQTSAGIGYATTPDGMVLGLLQGANIGQPQLVALPMSSVPGINCTNIVSAKTDPKSDAKKS